MFQATALIRMLAAAGAIYPLSGFGADLSVTSGSGSAGSPVVVNLMLSDASTRPVASLQFTLAYSAGHFSSVSLAAGAALAASGKSLACAPASSVIHCIASGLNNSAIPNGVIAAVTATPSPGSSSARAINIASAMGASAGGAGVLIGTGSGSITVIQAAPDVAPPTVSLVQPAAYATLTGSTTIVAAAADNVRVAGVQFLLDGANLGPELTSPPYSMVWPTATAGNGLHTLAARARDTAGLQTTSALIPVDVSNTAEPGGDAISGMVFHPVAPCRAVDTRFAAYGLAFGPPMLKAQSIRTFPIAASPCGIPASAGAYSVNVTVVPVRGLAYLTAWPSGQGLPGVSTLNSFDGRVVANAAIIPSGAGGAISVYASDDTEVIIDVNGYFDRRRGAGSGLAFYPAVPCRIADSRSGEYGVPFGLPSVQAGSIRTLPMVASRCALPPFAQAYALNVTAIPLRGVLGFLSAWPAAQAFPGVSTLNSWTGTVVANAAIVPAGPGGAINLMVTDPSDVVIDTNGYFAPAGVRGGLSFHPVVPCRAADTRVGGQTPLSNSSRDFLLAATTCGIPAEAQAYSLNVTAVPHGVLQYLTVWPAGTAQPWVSTLNSWNGAVVANAAIVAAGTQGAISVYASDKTDLIIDINGYFSP